MQCIGSEWKKIWKKNYGLLFLIVTMIAGASFFVITYQQTNPAQERYEDIIVSFSDNPGAISWSESDFIEDGNYNSRNEEIMNDLINVFNSTAESINNINIQWENTKVGIEPNPSVGGNWEVDPLTIQLNLEQWSHLKEHKIEPRLPLRVQQTRADKDRAYRNSKNIVGEAKKEATLFTDYHLSRFDKGWYKIWQIFIDQIYLILVALIVVLFGSLLAIEETKKRNHLHLLIVEGTTPIKLYISKIIVSLSSAGVFLLSGMGSILFTSIFFIGTGSLNYPVTFHFYREASMIGELPKYFLHPYFTLEGSDFSVTSVSLGRYLFQTFTLTLLVLFFLFSLMYLCSIFIKNEIVISLIGLGFMGLSFLLPIYSYNPFSYFNVHEVVSGEIRMVHENNTISFERGFLILLSWSILLVIVGSVLYQWRQVERREG